MSAFMCSERHISALVSFAAKEDVRYEAKDGHVVYIKAIPKEIAKILFTQNALSVNHCYPDHPQETARGMNYREVDLGLTPLDIIKLCNCFDYQACETDGYDWTEPALIINKIREEATRKLPGYDNAKYTI